MLASQADGLEEATPSPVGAVFGASAQGQQLNHHADLARQHVAEAVLQMAAGLRGYGHELGSHVVRMDDTDTRNAIDLSRLAEATSCVAAQGFAPNDTCTLPTAATDGNA